MRKSKALRQKSLLVDLQGGLANQLFQWACAEIVAELSGASICYDVRTLERPNDRGNQIGQLGLTGRSISPEPLSRWVWVRLHRTLSPRWFTLLSSYARPSRWRRSVSTTAAAIEELALHHRTILNGYFEEVSLVREWRAFLVGRLLPELQEYQVSTPSSYAAMHVRRGDYVSDALIAQKFGPCTVEYYLAGAARISPGLPIVIVSDDPVWVRSEFIPRLGRAAMIIDSATTHFNDLYILSQAQEIVMSNSTFSWWGVFLGDPGRVVCPKPWDAEGREHFFSPAWEMLDKVSGEG